MNFGEKFESGLEYLPFLQAYGTDLHQQKWSTVHDQVALTSSQINLIADFVREMKVIVFAGTWCGDCVNQCPIFDHFSAANAKIRIRFFDRDDNPDLGELLMTCGAPRVPAVIFLSEDNTVCGRYGDRTLSKYREMAGTQLGPTCPTGIGGVEQSLLNSVTQDWLDEFERIQWMLRLSGRLRQIHGD